MSALPALSKTKAAIISRWETNPLLQAPILSAVATSSFDLSVDQPSMTPPDGVLAASWGALERGETHYVDSLGIAPLREALAQWLQEMGMASAAPARTMAVSAMQEARFLTLQKLGELLGPIGLPAIVYPGARLALGTRSREVIEIAVDPASPTLLPTPAAIEGALQAGAKVLYLESPVRLSGALYDAAALQTIAGLLIHYEAAAIWDQGLAPWVEGAQAPYQSLAALPEMADRVVVIGEAWPGLGLASWPISYIGAQPAWLEPFRSQKQIMSICTNTASQYAALAAGLQYPSLHAGQIAQLATARQEAIAQAAQVGSELLSGDVLTFLALRRNEGAESMLKAAGYSWADGADFGAPGVMRVAIMGRDT